MTTITHAHPVPRGARTALLVGRGLLAAVGAFGLAAVTLFTFVAPPSAGGVSTALDVVVAAWKVAVCATMLYAAGRPGLPPRRRARVALVAIVADAAFGVVKLLHYGEQAALVFLLVDAVLLALVAPAGRTAVARRG